MRLHAKTAEDCWRIARREAEAFQRKLNQATDRRSMALCRAGRQAADRIALKIRYGRKRP